MSYYSWKMITKAKSKMIVPEMGNETGVEGSKVEFVERRVPWLSSKIIAPCHLVRAEMSLVTPCLWGA